jgi:preprotein translocase subunit SecA
MAGNLSLWDHLKEVEVLGGIADGIGKMYTRFFGSRNERIIREHLPEIALINDFEAHYESLSDDELRAETDRLQKVVEGIIEAAGGNKILEGINGLKEDFRSEEADAAAKEYRKVENKALDDIRPQAFAAVREATKRALRIRHYDVQMLGGAFLHQNRIAEMITGEGKTLVANLPCYLNAIPGLGVHVVTVNDYLAKRDAEWNANLLAGLGVTIGVIQSHMANDDRREAYACHITYGTNSEFGFDYLRDNMKVELERQVQGRFKSVIHTDSEGQTTTKLERVHNNNSILGNLNYAIVDEVDSILIDDARTPLIISGGAMKQTDAYYTADAIAKRLRGVPKPTLEETALKEEKESTEIENRWDFVFSEKDRSVYFTETGIAKAEKMLGRGSIYEPQNHDWPHFLEQALSAHNLYKRDNQYVVEDNEVIIVDENTGRKMQGRTWSDGLHQAIEAKEGLKTKDETQTLATITLQNYFRIYSKLAGMTGTAMTEAAEFQKIYNLDAVAMPTNWPLRRGNYGDVIYLTLREKFRAVCAEVEAVNAMGRPILVGTVSVENSERISEMLSRRGIKHDVLNAKQHQREASIVEVAGQLGRVTIATNMAGRGTDIVLGKFTKQELLDHWIQHKAAPKGLKIDDLDFYEKLMDFQKTRMLSTNVSLYDEWEHRTLLLKFENKGKSYSGIPLVTEISKLGGLHIIGTERHEARRIDNQLRGRCGRQGDPGSSRFYLSLEDDLMRIFASDRVSWLLEKIGMEDGQEISHKMVTNAVEKAQKKVESHHFDVRKNLLEYDAVMDEQRKLVYNERQSTLESKDLTRILYRWFEKTLDNAVGRWCNTEVSQLDWDIPALCDWSKKKFDFRIFPKDLSELSSNEIGDLIWVKIKEAYATRKKEIGEAEFIELERFLLLEKVDEKWKDHLHAMDQLRSAIGLAGYAQEDPKVKYKKVGYEYFEEMWDNIADEISDLLFHVRLAENQELEHTDHWNITSESTSTDFDAEQRAQRSQQVEDEAYAGSQGTEKRSPERRKEPKIKRNAPCPCGSGKKYKKCCGKK